MVPGRFTLSIRRWTVIVACTAIFAYGHTLGHGFVFDDFPEVVHNAYVRSLTHVWPVVTSTAWAGADQENHLYRPFTTISYLLNYALAGLSPWSYHLTNIALHALVTVLLFLLALRWGLAPEAAGLGALLFAVHPIHVEVVANVAGRKELLVGLFMLLALLAHTRALQRGGLWMGLAPMAYAAAMLSKETGAATLGLFLLQDVLLRRRNVGEVGRSRPTLLYAAHGFMLVSYLIIRWSVVGRFAIGEIDFLDNPTAYASPWVRVMTATAVVGRGLGLLVAPVTLSPDYSYRTIPLVESPLDSGFLVTILVIVGLAVAAVAFRRTDPVVPVALSWYTLTLLPAANLLFPVGTIFGERLLYVPSAAFCLLAGHLLVQGLAALGPVTAASLLFGVLAALGLRTATYAAVWKDELTLFTEAARVAPNSTKVHLNLGITLMTQGRPEEAIRAQERALSIYPDNHDATIQLAAVHQHLGRLDLADQLYRRALVARPTDVGVLHALGVIRRVQGRLPEAADFWSQALAVDPKHAPSLSDLGNIRLLAGDFETAQDLYERAVNAAPDSCGTWYNLGVLYERTGQARLARGAWRRFLETAGDEDSERVIDVRQKLGEPR